MRSSQTDLFTTITTEGSLLPSDFLQRLSQNDRSVEGLKPVDYHLDPTEKLNEAISRSWTLMLSAWANFHSAVEKLPESDIGTTVTRERWLQPLFKELGYGRLITAKAIEIEGKQYPISHFWQNTPIHLISFRAELDKRSERIIGASRSSPHSMMQEFLNRSHGHLWAVVSNGYRLRILRDNVSLIRQAYVEFDLQAMMEGEVFADFVLLYLLCHQSRVEAERPELCWLEKWTQSARLQGTRALDQLRVGVEDAINALGSGFLSYPANSALREKLKSGTLSTQDYYRQLLRTVYRFLFLFVAEDRDVLLVPTADAIKRSLFTKFYSTARLRQLAAHHTGTKHPDVWHSVQLLFSKLSSSHGCPELGLPALGSFLWSGQGTPDLDPCVIANRDVLHAIRLLAFTEHARTLRPVDYKNLGMKELGSVYTSLLEQHPHVNVDAGTFTLEVSAGNERKTTGSYYTDDSLVQCLLDSALDPVLDEASKKPNAEQAILALKVCDGASGSGHFLIAAAHRMAKRLAAIRTGEDEPAPEAIRTALRDVIGHCMYGVDINPMAVELCKFALWLEALEPGKPLSFLDHHIKCGNSLLGATPALMKQGIPDAAFEPIEGDDKAVCREYKKINKKEREQRQMGLFSYADKPWEQLGDVSAHLMSLIAIGDDTVEAVHEKEKRYAELMHSTGYEYTKLLADAWCAAFVWKKTKDFPYPITEEVFRKIEKNPFDIPVWMKNEVQRLTDQYQFFHWHLAFPDVFFVNPERTSEGSESSVTGWTGGFDVMLGNPPWEKAQFEERQFLESKGIKLSASNATFRKQLLAEDDRMGGQLSQLLLDAREEAEREALFLTTSGRFPDSGRGKFNEYAIFLELTTYLVGSRGRVGLIVKSGFVTDQATSQLFSTLISKGRIERLIDFENSEGLFPDVAPPEKFCLVTLGPVNACSKTVFCFNLTNTSQLSDPERFFELSKEDIWRFNPNTKTCPVFRSRRDATITKKVFDTCPVLVNIASNDNPFSIQFFQQFNVTDDAELFRTASELEAENYIRDKFGCYRKRDEAFLPLIEPKFFHHYDHRFGTYEGVSEGTKFQRKASTNRLSDEQKTDPWKLALPRYWLNRQFFLEKTVHRWEKNFYFVFRGITNISTNMRTVIGTIIPAFPLSKAAPAILLDDSSDGNKSVILATMFLSFPFDYFCRQKIGGPNLNLFIVEQLPVIRPETLERELIFLVEGDEARNWFTPRALELIYTAWDLESFAIDCGYDGPPFKWDEERRFLLRCELDAAYFHLYGIERDDVDYIMETFPIVKRKDEAKHGEYRTKRVILEIYDEMKHAMETGVAYKTRLDPPPADPRVAHAPREAESLVKAAKQIIEQPAVHPQPEATVTANEKGKSRPGVRIKQGTILAYTVIENQDATELDQIKMEKLLYFAQELLDLNLEMTFDRGDFGPFDSGTYAIESFAERVKKWIKVRRAKKQFAIQYKPAQNLDEVHAAMVKYYNSWIPKLQELFSQFKNFSRTGIEIWATLHFSWKSLKVKNSVVTREMVIQDVLEWKGTKKPFTEENLRIAMGKMEEKGYIKF